VSLPLFASSGSVGGLLVTVDGPNGSGKTSIAAELGKALMAARQRVHETQEPSSSPLGALARASEATVKGQALACLVAADRHHQLATEIVPALRSGAVVVCDRYLESSLVLQRIDGVEVEFILAANSGIQRPDLRVRLIASESVLQDRLAARLAGPERRFERMAGGSRRELELYAEADALLTERFELPSVLLDTTSSVPAAHAASIMRHVQHRFEEGR
jgi:dTMP kinase